MATVISAVEYELLSGYYADLRTTLNASTVYLYDAVYSIVLLNDIEPTLDLLQAFNDTYNIQTATLLSNAPFLSAVRALNNHILNRATKVDGTKYSTIMQWMADSANNVKVHSKWIDMCTDAGTTINKNSTYCLDC